MATWTNNSFANLIGIVRFSSKIPHDTLAAFQPDETTTAPARIQSRRLPARRLTAGIWFGAYQILSPLTAFASRRRWMSVVALLGTPSLVFAQAGGAPSASAAP